MSGLFGESRSKFVSNKDLTSGDTIEFLDNGSWCSVDFSKARDGSDVKDVYQVNVSVNGHPAKIMSLNKTSRDSLAEGFNNDPKGLKGKKATVTFITQLAFGKKTKVLELIALRNDVFQGTNAKDIPFDGVV